MIKNRGITLVALVITVIILLILAGISIATLTNNGLFENTKLSKEKYENSEEKEKEILNDYEKWMNTYIENVRQEKGGTATPQKILKDYTAYVDGKLITGIMPNNVSEQVILNQGETYTIPEGYHNGNGTVTSNINNVKVESFQISTTEKTTVTLGFKPTYLAILYGNNLAGNIYNAELSETKATYFGSSTPGTYYTIGSSTTNNHIYSINSDGFTINKGTSDYVAYYFAIK